MRRFGVFTGAMLLTFCAVGCGQKTQFSMDAGTSMTEGADKMTSGHTGPQTHVGQGMGDKIVRGFINTFTGIVEWPMQTYKGYVRGATFIENKGASKTVGTAMGLILTGPAHAVGRTASGVLDVLTFWLPNPPDNKGVGTPLDGKYSWEMGQPYSIFKPSLGEGIKPWGTKLVRGLGNGIGGILEIPGQIKKGHQSKDSNVGMGILKGFWFFMGRTANGIGEAITFFVPNPEDQMGYGFEEEWPWTALGN